MDTRTLFGEKLIVCEYWGQDMDSKEELFRSIYMQNLPVVRIIAKRFQIPPDQIDDVAQNVFMAFYKAYGADRSVEESRRLLARITRNCCLDYKRQQNARPEFSCDPFTIEEELFGDAFYADDNLSILLRKQNYEHVAEALSSLKKESEAIIRLYVIEGRPMAEVAQILGIEEDTFRIRLHRARKELKKEFHKQSMMGEPSRKRSFPEGMNLREA